MLPPSLLPETSLPLPAPDAARLVRAMRLWVACARRSQSPRALLAEVLGPAGPLLARFMERVVAAWPDPLAVMPPCACRLTHDEALLLALVARAGACDRDGADRQLCEMFAPDERARLWAVARALAEGLEAAL